MFIVNLAGLNIAIDNKYDYVKTICENYITFEKEYDFIASASITEIHKEKSLNNCDVPDEIIESICIYRNIAEQLPRFDGFVFHSAAIEFNQKAYCFAAKSGTGKTTHINQWRKAFGKTVNIINGDKPILRLIGKQVYACGTPWSGKERLNKNTIFPLNGIAFLHRSDVNNITPINTQEALNELIKQVYIPNSSDAFEKTIKLIEKIIFNIPTWRLECNVSEEAAILASATMTDEDRSGY